MLTHTYTYTHSHTHEHTYTHTHMYTHTHTYKDIHTPSCTHIYTNSIWLLLKHSFIYTHTLLHSHIDPVTFTYTHIHALLHYIHTECLHAWGTAMAPGCETCDILKSSMALGTVYPQASPVAVWPHQGPQFSALYSWAQGHLGDQPASPNFPSWKWETIKKQRAPLCPSSWTLHCFISGLESTPLLHSLIFLRYRKRSATTRQD